MFDNLIVIYGFNISELFLHDEIEQVFNQIQFPWPSFKKVLFLKTILGQPILFWLKKIVKDFVLFPEPHFTSLASHLVHF